MAPTRISEYRFLVVAPLGRDHELLIRQLAHFQIRASAAATVPQALEQLDANGAAGLILTDEALNDTAAARLCEAVRNQPDWSDLPILILTSGDSQSITPEKTIELQDRFGNVTLVQRPVRVQTLATAARSALRARRRQYELRDSGSKQQQTEEALRRSERLAIAGTMVAGLAHEINNPLSAVNNFLFLIEEASTLEEAQQFAGSATAELRRISDIVNNTLQYHRAPLTPSKVNIGELLDSTLQLLQRRLERHRIAVKRRYRSIDVWCVSGEIRQVLVNLVANAIDATCEGGTLLMRAHKVESRLGIPGVRISVADVGSGIPLSARSRLFSQFFTTKGDRGTGLGLWLSKDLIAKNGGFIQMKTRTGEHSGTVFSFWLPSPAKPADLATASESEFCVAAQG